MVHALLLLAAAAAEPSKTAFYIAGGALAAWAVVLTAIGMTQPDFPSNEGASRGVMALSVLLVAATMAAAVATS
jgi:hypothetical protein